MKRKDEAKAIKVKRYKNRMKTADKAPYLMRVVSNGEVHLDDILQEVAKETGWTLPTVRMYYSAFFEQLTEELQQGHKVKTALVCTLSGAAAKGKATLEVVLAGEEPDTYRFTASRKVTVR